MTLFPRRGTETVPGRIEYSTPPLRSNPPLECLNLKQTTIIIHLMLSLLCRLLMVRLVDCTVNLSDFYSYRLIGKLTAFFSASGVQSAQSNLGASYFHLRRAAFSSLLKSRVGNIIAKASALRVNLNLDGSPIASSSHTHPSHSQTSRLLTSSLSLGVPVPRPTQCMGDA
jgi:hypothetical protein